MLNGVGARFAKTNAIRSPVDASARLILAPPYLVRSRLLLHAVTIILAILLIDIPVKAGEQRPTEPKSCAPGLAAPHVCWPLTLHDGVVSPSVTVVYEQVRNDHHDKQFGLAVGVRAGVNPDIEIEVIALPLRLVEELKVPTEQTTPVAYGNPILRGTFRMFKPSGSLEIGLRGSVQPLRASNGVNIELGIPLVVRNSLFRIESGVFVPLMARAAEEPVTAGVLLPWRFYFQPRKFIRFGINGSWGFKNVRSVGDFGIRSYGDVGSSPFITGQMGAFLITNFELSNVLIEPSMNFTYTSALPDDMNLGFIQATFGIATFFDVN
jgi:hypothetical protein